MASALLLAWAAPGETATWTSVGNLAPAAAGTMLQLTDGTVMVQNNSSDFAGWMRLTPDSAGSYVGGTWSSLAAMGTPRLYFASHVLRNGDVWVLGGEYTGNPLAAVWTRTGEKYSFSTNTWSAIAPHPEAKFGDVPSMLLDGDKILAGSLTTQTTYLYDIAANTWSVAANKFYADRSDEESWVKLSGGKILTYDIFQSVGTGGGYAELFNPATNTWSSISPSDGHAPGTLPLLSSSAVGYEQGAAVRLCDGRIFVIGAGAGSPLTAHTALYTASTNTWAAGPDIPGGYLADDAPATVMPNCHVLMAANLGHWTSTYTPPTALFDFNPGANTITPLASLPAALANQLANVPAYATRLLMLPTGQVLLANSYNQAWVYSPDGTPDPQLRPVINKVTYSGGLFHLTGKRITGESAGGSYGDDAESDQNYPIIRLQNRTNVYYVKTSNWSSTAVGTGSSLLTADFCLQPGTPAGNYTMVMSAAGIQSFPVAISIPATAATCQ